VNEEVVDLFHEVIDATIVVVPNPREKIADGLFQAVFKIRSKRLMSSTPRILSQFSDRVENINS
jgi:hypothetical protein